ncbi:hypothetical protein [Roseibium salinum]|uniref:Uncharacterized protein n=1 Tax=Roseibium salinum TaxID=1604349 RepID=A0ABT3R285_9HYPH|nr:hypothetical protein [Roseibium sp. DSM 29163]MCX2723272.1 hypothetical protein [Roseibium sp. DSM 29163]
MTAVPAAAAKLLGNNFIGGYLLLRAAEPGGASVSSKRRRDAALTSQTGATGDKFLPSADFRFARRATFLGTNRVVSPSFKQTAKETL